MERIPWTRLSGNDVEEMLAVMLLLDYPLGKHVRAHPGDGGIDVFVPVDPTASIGVNYQIKNFPDKIEDSQKRQIRKSLRAAKKTTESGDFVITHTWVVVTTLPTTADEKWLQHFTRKEGLPFTTSWYGMSHVEGLVSKHPNVVDYYLENRQSHYASLLKKSMQLTIDSLQLTGDTTGDNFNLTQLPNVLAGLQEKLDQDPLYSYHFGTSPVYPSLEEKPLLVLTQISQLGDDLYLTVDVFARFADAVNIRPCTIRVTFNPADPSEEKQLDDFKRFGSEVTAGAKFELDFPGGLGSDFSEGIVHVSPATDGLNRIMNYRVLNQQDEPVGQVFLRAQRASRGMAEPNNYEVVCIDEAEVFSLTWRWDLTNQKTIMNFALRTLEGRIAREILPSVEFLASLNADHVLEISERYVPRSRVLHKLDYLPDPNPWVRLAKLIRYLSDVQTVVEQVVTVPKLEDLTREDIRSLIECSKLARGEVIRGRWQSLTLDAPSENLHAFTGNRMMRATGVKDLTLGEVTYVLGEAEAIYKSARLDVTSEPIRVVPGETDEAIFRLVSRDHAARSSTERGKTSDLN